MSLLIILHEDTLIPVTKKFLYFIQLLTGAVYHEHERLVLLFLFSFYQLRCQYLAAVDIFV